ncbi:hypothetical protein [Chromobacterium phragmitis]|uniref:EVE domain-containing protein n=1 Tax=Chromobacterium phragmitis TaxID=2202141 RepID=A0ABV0J0Y5_9NEIS
MATYCMEFIGGPEDFAGVAGEFNTLRLGLAWHKRLAPGDRLVLFRSKTAEAFGVAEVTRTEKARLPELLSAHARHNHKETGQPDPQGAPERRRASMTKIYGPQRVTDGRYGTAIYMRMIDHDFGV